MLILLRQEPVAAALCCCVVMLAMMPCWVVTVAIAACNQRDVMGACEEDISGVA